LIGGNRVSSLNNEILPAEVWPSSSKGNDLKLLALLNRDEGNRDEGVVSSTLLTGMAMLKLRFEPDLTRLF